MKTAIALRHVAFEDLGSLAPLLRRRGFEVRCHDAVLEPESLDAMDPDLLVVLGGPVGAFDDSRYPFLKEELKLIGRRLSAKRPVLGICLGAQLMARALGAGVKPMVMKEIGFHPVELTSRGRDSVLAVLSSGTPVLHWHGDTFDIPIGAECLAGTPMCPHQAFTVGNHALGLQFHAEVDCRRIDEWLVGHACELSALGLDPKVLRAQALRNGRELASAADLLFSAWLDHVEIASAGAAA